MEHPLLVPFRTKYNAPRTRYSDPHKVFHDCLDALIMDVGKKVAEANKNAGISSIEQIFGVPGK